MKQNYYTKGSEWKKWDLHIHTPASFFWNDGKLFKDMDQDEKEQSIKTFIEKINASNTVVFCIMDYWTFDWCIALKKYKNDLKKTVFSGMELRVESSTDYRLNIHVILSNILTEQQLNDFKSTLQIRIGRNLKILSNEALIEFARSLGEDKAKIHGYSNPEILDENQLLKLGSETAEITRDSLISALKELPKNNGYIILPYDTSDGLLKLDWKKHPQDDNFFMQSADIFESRDQRNIDLLNGVKTQNNKKFFTNFYKTLGEKPKPCVSGSDAHKFNNYGICPSDRHTWIKAEPTFEGLKQIIYEPQNRVCISNDEPKKPINTIDSFTLKIPKETKVGEDTFCYANKNESFNLSPYFNCFIGGRGSGKSTILNFFGLRSNNPESSKLFWFGDNKDKKGLNPTGFNPNDDGVFSFKGTEIFEFLAQSEIENFARDKIKFTQAIYDRANGPNKVLQKFEDDILKYQVVLDKIIESSFDLQDLLAQKKFKEKEKRSLENTKNIIESKDYKKLTDSISKLTQKIQTYKKWSNEVYLLKTQLSDTINFYSKILNKNNDQIKYKDSYLSAISKVREAIETLDEKNFKENEKEEQSYQDNLLLLEEKLKELLNNGNFSKENIEQIKSAPQKIVTLEREIEQIGFQIDGKNKIISTFEDAVLKLKISKENYEDEIKKIVNPLQKLLEKQFDDNKGKDIKKIYLEYSFDENRAWNTLVKEFYELFKENFKESEKGKDVCEYITDNKSEFLSNKFEDIQKFIKQSNKNNRQYINFIDEVFKDKNNFQIFQAIRDKHLYDVRINKIIQVKYDNKNIEQASFGQRCTAVVVILLLFGNYPLIIDEPEAHLDSSLIANYLVPLIKEKKSDRQIIFATHNANFVINGDAEKIFILKNDSGKTEIIETTIENLDHRKELLKLEGGKDAFEKRGEKLDLIKK